MVGGVEEEEEGGVVKRQRRRVVRRTPEGFEFGARFRRPLLGFVGIFLNFIPFCVCNCTILVYKFE